MYRAENILCPIALLLHKRTLVGILADSNDHSSCGVRLGRRKIRRFTVAVQPLSLDDRKASKSASSFWSSGSSRA